MVHHVKFMIKSENYSKKLSAIAKEKCRGAVSVCVCGARLVQMVDIFRGSPKTMFSRTFNWHFIVITVGTALTLMPKSSTVGHVLGVSTHLIALAHFLCALCAFV